MAALKDTTKKIMEYLRAHDGEDLTSEDVANALGMSKRSVDGSFTSFQNENKKWGYREEGGVVVENGKPKVIKYLRLTEAGKTVDLDAEEAPAEK